MKYIIGIFISVLGALLVIIWDMRQTINAQAARLNETKSTLDDLYNRFGGTGYTSDMLEIDYYTFNHVDDFTNSNAYHYYKVNDIPDHLKFYGTLYYIKDRLGGRFVSEYDFMMWDEWLENEKHEPNKVMQQGRPIGRP